MPKIGFRQTSYLSAVACGILLLASGPAAAANYSINYRGKTSFSKTATTIDQGGVSINVSEMSGVVYRGGNSFTAVCDENGKLINLNVTFNNDGSIATSAIAGGYSLPNVPNVHDDYEGIAYTNTTRNSVFVSNESTAPSPPPAIYEFSLTNPSTLLQTIKMPAVFANQRDNRGLESLTRRPDGTEMWTANEEALTVDGPVATASAGTVVRLQRLAVSGNTVTPAQQYAYVVDPIHSGIGSPDRSGISDLVELPDGTILALERSAIVGLPIFQSRIYQITFGGATDISQGALANGLIGQTYTPVTKTLLFSSTAIGENFEGLCLGPQLPSGNYSLLGVCDSGDQVTSNTLVALELVATVPEPQAWMLAAGGAGLAVLLVVLRRIFGHRKVQPA
jgi:hypothetical protein